MYMPMTEPILSHVSRSLKSPLAALPQEVWEGLEEIRIRPGLPVLLKNRDGESRLGDAEIFPAGEMPELMEALSEASLYAITEELRQGFLTLPGGHRVGFCGHAVLEQGRIRLLRDISSVNIRIARAVPGGGKALLPKLCRGDGALLSTLILSPPGAGKTTLLRDIARCLGDGDGCEPLRVGIADERSELAATRQGIPQLPVGLRSDVLDGCPKAEGLMLLLRSMNPQVLICDELGRAEDVAAVAEAVNAGVPLIATAHGDSLERLRARPVFRSLLAEGGFQRLVILSRRMSPGTVEQVISI